MLFVLKFVAGLAANSLAIIADAVNSLLDTVYSIGVYWSVGESHKKADKGHPFGHARAEPMVGFAVALLMGIAAFVFLQNALFSFFAEPQTYTLNWVIVSSMVIAIIAKIFLSHKSYLAARKTRSPALMATSIDSRNDIIITLVALAGIVFASTGMPRMDNIAAIVISVFLFSEAYRVGKSNANYLIGAAPSPALTHKIKQLATHVRGVRGIHFIKAHYVGNYVHVQIGIAVSGRISTTASNHIAMTVQHDIEKLPDVNKAFITVDAV